MADIFDKAYNYTIAKKAIAGGYYPYFIQMSSNEGTESVYKGKRVIMCGSNNYLGLTMHPQVKEAAIKATLEQGTSCTGSRFLNGNLNLHHELERKLAKWVGKESALIFSTGMQVNLGVISAIISRKDVVILDKEVHASIVDGAILSLGDIRRFSHNNMNSLEKVLSGIPENTGKLIVVDGLYSMGGDLANLPEITYLSKKYKARLMVDDAHGMGIFGNGHGTVAHFGLTDEVDLIMSTFSKSFGSLGGFIAGDEQVIHYIQHHARSLIFSASITPANTAAAMASLRVMEEEPERIRRVNENGKKMRTGLIKLGFNIGNSISPIVPILIGDDMRTISAWWALLNHGVYVNAILSPAVPKGQQLLRTSYMATHTDEQLDKVLATFEEAGKEIGLI
ncbi:MAG: pyridoxal phosphate-dependent aminotransferase family protein [Bacteroidales bacterium]|nr:pyridoxal phosphate-dependent aminotransferase family protein [Bacteroidales bacterium]